MHPFCNSIYLRANAAAWSGEKSANARLRNNSSATTALLGIYRTRAYFPQSIVTQPHQEYEWLSGTINLFAKA